MSTDEELDPRFNGATDQVKLQDFYQQAARAIELTGGSVDTLAEALDQWEREREALSELFDEHQAWTIINRRLRLLMTLAVAIINTVEIDAAMFMTQKTRNKIAQFREQHQKAENAIVQSKLLIDHTLERRALDTITEE